MTGTGVQADPFIVDNWPDFVTAAGTSGAYVAFPTTPGVIDMNDVAPGGVEETTVRCANIQGNGWSVKNLYCAGDNVFRAVGNVSVSDLHFLNFYVDFQNENNKFFWNQGLNYLETSLIGCQFSGELHSSASSQNVGLFCNSGYSSFIRRYRCALNVKLDNSCALFYASGTSNTNNNLSFTTIKLSGNSEKNIAGDYINCLFTGKSKAAEAAITYNGRSNFNVFDVDFKEAAAFSCSAPSGSLNLINSDKLPAGAVIGTGFVGVTTAQLGDAAYLASLGFPIAEE